MTFSVYSSIKNIPRELQEAADVYRLSWWQKLIQLELPYSAIGLVWNSMMSVAGGWFFLMACEMFVLGNRDLRLPGLGSYLQTAANAGNTSAIVWGLATMIAVIVLMDQLIWRPVIAWSEKFKFEQVEAFQTPRSPVLDLLRHSRLVSFARPRFGGAVARSSDAAFREAARFGPGTCPAQDGEVGPARAWCCGRGGDGLRRRADGCRSHRDFAPGLAGDPHGAPAPPSCALSWFSCSPGLDRPGRRIHRTAAKADRYRPTDCPDRGFGARHGSVPDCHARADPPGRGAGDRLHRAAAARHAMVPSVQRHCGCDRDPHGPQRSLRRLPPQQHRPLAQTAPAGDLSRF